MPGRSRSGPPVREGQGPARRLRRGFSERAGCGWPASPIVLWMCVCTGAPPATLDAVHRARLPAGQGAGYHGRRAGRGFILSFMHVLGRAREPGGPAAGGTMRGGGFGAGAAGGRPAISWTPPRGCA